MQKQNTTVAKHSTHTRLPSLGLGLERERDRVWLGESPRWLFELSGFRPWRSNMGLGLY